MSLSIFYIYTKTALQANLVARNFRKIGSLFFFHTQCQELLVISDCETMTHEYRSGAQPEAKVIYSKTCLKRPLKNRHNRGLNGKW